MGKMFMKDRFKINQQKFNNFLKLQAITTISLSFPNMAYEVLTDSS